VKVRRLSGCTQPSRLTFSRTLTPRPAPAPHWVWGRQASDRQTDRQTLTETDCDRQEGEGEGGGGGHRPVTAQPACLASNGPRFRQYWFLPPTDLRLITVVTLAHPFGSLMRIPSKKDQSKEDPLANARESQGLVPSSVDPVSDQGIALS
jgi:hypothetical protein